MAISTSGGRPGQVVPAARYIALYCADIMPGVACIEMPSLTKLPIARARATRPTIAQAMALLIGVRSAVGGHQRCGGVRDAEAVFHRGGHDLERSPLAAHQEE